MGIPVSGSNFRRSCLGLEDQKDLKPLPSVAAGVCLGPEKGLYALFFGLVFGGFFGLGLTVLKKRKKEEAIPLGPFLAAGIAAESLSFFFY